MKGLNKQDLRYLLEMVDNQLAYETEKDFRDYQETLILKIEKEME